MILSRKTNLLNFIHLFLFFMYQDKSFFLSPSIPPSVRPSPFFSFFLFLIVLRGYNACWWLRNHVVWRIKLGPSTCKAYISVSESLFSPKSVFSYYSIFAHTFRKECKWIIKVQAARKHGNVNWHFSRLHLQLLILYSQKKFLNNYFCVFL